MDSKKKWSKENKMCCNWQTWHNHRGNIVFTGKSELDHCQESQAKEGAGNSSTWLDGMELLEQNLE